MSEKRHKINKFANYQKIMVRISPAFDCLACVAGVERGRGRGNLGARESVHAGYRLPCFCFFLSPLIFGF